MSSLLFHFIPTVLEIGLVCGIFAYSFGPTFAVTTVVTVSMYAALTLSITSWRNKFRKVPKRTRKRLIDSVSHAVVLGSEFLRESSGNDCVNSLCNRLISFCICQAAKSTDSLLNLETVKSFTNEEEEAKRFEQCLSQGEAASLKVRLLIGFSSLLLLFLAGFFLSRVAELWTAGRVQHSSGRAYLHGGGGRCRVRTNETKEKRVCFVLFHLFVAAGRCRSETWC